MAAISACRQKGTDARPSARPLLMLQSQYPPHPRSIALMVAPETRPAQCAASGNHRAGQVAEDRRNAPGSRARSARRPFGSAGHGCRSNDHMPFPKSAAWPAEEPNQPIARRDRVDRRARLSRPAAPVHFPGSDTRDPDLDVILAAPQRTVAVINSDRGALKTDAGRHRRGAHLPRWQEIPADQGDRKPGQETCHSQPIPS